MPWIVSGVLSTIRYMCMMMRRIPKLGRAPLDCPALVYIYVQGAWSSGFETPTQPQMKIISRSKLPPRVDKLRPNLIAHKVIDA